MTANDEREAARHGSTGHGGAGYGDDRVAALDLLRGFAAFAVAVPHFLAYRDVVPEAAEAISSIAVEVFFVLSGYVLAPQILFCLKTGRGHDLGIFLSRRWMRTIPPYVLALLAISVLGQQSFSADFFRYLTYTQNLARQSNTLDYFSVAWSLSVEEWFYVGFPSLLLLVAFLVGRRGGAFAAGFGVVFCLAIGIARYFWGDFADWGAGVRRIVLFRLDSIGYGFLLYMAMQSAVRDRLFRFGPAAWGVAACLAAALCYGLLIVIVRTGDRAAENLYPFAAALFGAASIVVAVRAEAAIGTWPRLRRLGRYLGRVSYSTYLFHIILIELMGAAPLSLPAPVLFVGYLLALLGVATLLFRYVESPILAARPRYRARPVGAAAVVPASTSAPSQLSEPG